MILVTGGTGLVGSHLILNLLNKGYEVKVLVRNTSNRQNVLNTFRHYTTEADQLFNKIIWTEGDLSDMVSLEDALEGVQQVYHAAAFVSFNPWVKKKIIETNVEGTANLVNLCVVKQIEKLCFVSSIASLGVTEDDSEITENIPWKPTKHESAYSISKFKSEMEVWRGIAEGLNAVIINPTVILGPGNWENGSASIVNIIDRGFPFYTEGVVGFVDVRDVAEIMVKLMESQIHGERFIVTSENISYKELFTSIANKLSVKPPRFYFSPWLSKILLPIINLKSILFASSTQISRSSVKISHKKLFYSSEKIIKAINIKFKPVNETLDNLIYFYKQDKMN
jgi:nucleoside-diphosphate-sugar epimerase